MLLIPPVYLVAILIVQRHHKIQVSLCRRHQWLQYLGNVISTLGLFLIFFCGRFALLLADVMHITPVPLIVFLTISVTLMLSFVSYRLTHLVRPRRMAEDMLWLSGCGDAFLASLPAFEPDMEPALRQRDKAA